MNNDDLSKEGCTGDSRSRFMVVHIVHLYHLRQQKEFDCTFLHLCVEGDGLWNISKVK